jgi:HK97 family phage prohead protease
MKNQIKFADYYKHLPQDIKVLIDAELSTCEIDQDELVIKRTTGQPIEQKDVDDTEHTSIGYASTRNLDFSLDIVVPKGIITTVYAKNPLVFYNHFTGAPPIGKAVKVSKDEMGLRVKIQYAVEEYEEASTIYKLVKGGYIRQHSIGYVPLELVWNGQTGFDELNKALKKEYPEYKGDAERIITKTLLLEVSVVNMADNQFALIGSVKDLGAKDFEAMKRLGMSFDAEEKTEKDEKTIEIKHTHLPEKDEKTIEIKLIQEPNKIIHLVSLPQKRIELIQEATRRGQIVWN